MIAVDSRMYVDCCEGGVYALYDWEGGVFGAADCARENYG
jgi:hypothetical protein